MSGSIRAGDPRSLTPREWVVYDALSPCVYLPAETARLPLRLPERRLTRRELGRRLDAGDRRQGLLLYRPTCPTCRACEPIRVEVERFVPSRVQRRIRRRGDAAFAVEIGRPEASPERVALYNRHKLERDLDAGDGPLGLEGYREVFATSCVETVEIRYRLARRLVAVAITDVADDALSAVYCYFDPDASRLSPGAYSILKQIELCREWGLRYLYLGLHVLGCDVMRYKTDYLPHERLVGGAWRTYDREGV